MVEDIRVRVRTACVLLQVPMGRKASHVPFRMGSVAFEVHILALGEVVDGLRIHHPRAKDHGAILQQKIDFEKNQYFKS